MLGVPLFVLLGWVGAAYSAVRLGLLLTPGLVAVPVAASLAALYDALADRRGVEAGYWTHR